MTIIGAGRLDLFKDFLKIFEEQKFHLFFYIFKSRKDPDPIRVSKILELDPNYFISDSQSVDADNRWNRLIDLLLIIWRFCVR